MRRHEITDEQWTAIAPLLPSKITDCGVTFNYNRLFFNAMIGIMRKKRSFSFWRYGISMQ